MMAESTFTRIIHIIAVPSRMMNAAQDQKRLIQHNNIAFTLGVKVYRFKEQLMWEVDTNG